MRLPCNLAASRWSGNPLKIEPIRSRLAVIDLNEFFCHLEMRTVDSAEDRRYVTTIFVHQDCSSLIREKCWDPWQQRIFHTAEHLSAVAAPRVIGVCLAGILAAEAVFCGTFSSSKAATMGRPWALDQAVERAGLIFEGTVVAIAFRDSDQLPTSQTTLPHTFVTYEVGKALRGRPENSTVDPAVLGGWSGKAGRIMRVPHARCSSSAITTSCS